MKFKRKRNTVIHIYEIDSKTNHRIDFAIENLIIEEVFYEYLLKDFNIFQIIQSDSTNIIQPDELEKNNIEYWSSKSLVKQKFITGLIIPPNDNDFLYRFMFGNYMYFPIGDEFNYNERDISDWLNQCFPDRFRDIDNLFAGQITNDFELLNGQGFILTTGYDSNRDIGIVIKRNNSKSIINWIKKTIKKSKIENFEIETFENCER